MSLKMDIYLTIIFLFIAMNNIRLIQSENCEDKYVNCIEKAKRGECKQNMTDMQNNCPKMCGLCSLLANERILKDFLFKHYDVAVRPKETFNKTVELVLNIYLLDIISVNDKSKTAELLTMISLFWTDDHLTWNPQNYGNVRTLHLPEDSVWRPDITLYNGVNAKQITIFEMCGSTNIVLGSQGDVYWVPPCNIKIFFEEKFETFPYDEIIIMVKLGSWVHDASTMTLSLSNSTEYLSYFRENSDWNVINASLRKNSVIYSCCPEPYEDVEFTLILQRRTHFYGITLVLINVLTAFIIGFVFFIAPENKSRVIILSINMVIITIELLFLVYHIPSFRKIPIIVKWAASIAVFNTLSIGLCVLCFQLIRNTCEVPGYMHGFVDKIGQFFLCSKNMNYSEDNTFDNIVEGSASDLRDDKSANVSNRYQWYVICKTLNNLFLVIYILVIVVLIITFVS